MIELPLYMRWDVCTDGNIVSKKKRRENKEKAKERREKEQCFLVLLYIIEILEDHHFWVFHPLD